MLLRTCCVLLFSPNEHELFYSCRAAAGSVSRFNSNKMREKAVQGDKSPKCSQDTALHTTSFTKQLLLLFFLSLICMKKEIMCIARNR